MNINALNNFNVWKNKLNDISKIDYQERLKMNEDNINDSFYKDLSFGTGGLRGKMGLGTNRINQFTIYKATRGVGLYLKTKFNKPSVVIGYDSRNHSREYAYISANVFANLGIKVFIFNELIPTPVVSFAIRYLKASAGVILTASHNPKEYNGYKVYNDGGNQITLEEANAITTKISEIDPLDEYLKFTSLNKESSFLINEIEETLIEDFIKSTKKTSLLETFSEKRIKIVYTPLNGAGYKLVPQVLKECGFKNLLVVKEQASPDGNFPTCPKPNPELKEAMELGIKLAKSSNSDLLIATDPDCDRCGVGVRYNDDFILLNGNQVAILMLNYLIKAKSNLSEKEIVRSIVSTSFVDKLAKANNIKVKEVLTGFKYIGEEMNRLERNDKLDKYIFGFEESYGYLTNKEVRDKDAVNASLFIAEMSEYYRRNGHSLIDELKNIYAKFGYNKTILLTEELDGESGLKRIDKIVQNLREMSFEKLSELFSENVLCKEDYLISKCFYKESTSEILLPKSNVLIFKLEDETRFMIRPSGTEPKIKCYIEVNDKDEEKCSEKLKRYSKLFKKVVNEL